MTKPTKIRGCLVRVATRNISRFHSPMRSAIISRLRTSMTSMSMNPSLAVRVRAFRCIAMRNLAEVLIVLWRPVPKSGMGCESDRQRRSTGLDLLLPRVVWKPRSCKLRLKSEHVVVGLLPHVPLLGGGTEREHPLHPPQAQRLADQLQAAHPHGSGQHHAPFCQQAQEEHAMKQQESLRKLVAGKRPVPVPVQRPDAGEGHMAGSPHCEEAGCLEQQSSLASTRFVHDACWPRGRRGGGVTTTR
eukprot:scaffold1004_cov269-Pinguiococcus_pyrenoidosus.AAC.3